MFKTASDVRALRSPMMKLDSMPLMEVSQVLAGCTPGYSKVKGGKCGQQQCLQQ